MIALLQCQPVNQCWCYLTCSRKRNLSEDASNTLRDISAVLKIRTFQILILQGVVGSSPWQVRIELTEVSGLLAMMLGRCHRKAAICGRLGAHGGTQLYLLPKHVAILLFLPVPSKTLIFKFGCTCICAVVLCLPWEGTASGCLLRRDSLSRMLRQYALTCCGLGWSLPGSLLCRRWSTSRCGCSSWDSATLRCGLVCSIWHPALL